VNCGYQRAIFLNLELPRDLESLFLLNAEVSGGILDALMPKEHLSDFEIGCFPVDMGDTGTAQGMRAVEGRVETGQRDPTLHQAAVAINAETSALIALLGREEGIAIGFILGLDQLLQRDTGIAAQGEGDALMGLALIDGHAFPDLIPLDHVRNIQTDDIDPAQAGIDGEGKHGDVAGLPSWERRVRIVATCSGVRGIFRPTILPRFQGFLGEVMGVIFTPAKTPFYSKAGILQTELAARARTHLTKTAVYQESKRAGRLFAKHPLL